MFKFLDDAPLECGKPAPPVLVSCMEFSHVMYAILIMMTMKILLITMIMQQVRICQSVGACLRQAELYPGRG